MGTQTRTTATEISGVLDALIESAINEQRDIEAQKRAKEAAERQQYIDGQIEVLRGQMEHKLDLDTARALHLAYGYGHIQGWSRPGFEHAHATIRIAGETLPLVIDATASDGRYVHWMLVTPDLARIRFKAYDNEPGQAQRNLLLALHYWLTGDKLYEE